MNTFENERKIEWRSFLTERERKAFEKMSVSASGAEKLFLSANKFSERTKALHLVFLVLFHKSVSCFPTEKRDRSVLFFLIFVLVPEHFFIDLLVLFQFSNSTKNGPWYLLTVHSGLR